MHLRIGDALKKKLHLQDSVLDNAALKAKEKGKRIGEVLVENNTIPEELLFQTLAEQYSMEFLCKIENHIDMELLRELPTELFREGRCFPLGSNETVLKIVVGDPLDVEIVQLAELYSDLLVHTVLSTPSEMEKVSNRLFEGNTLFKQSAGKISKEYEKQMQADESLTLEEIRQRTESEPVVRMVSLIFDEAVKLNVSDIHIEPSENDAVVRFRIDGMLRQYTELTKWMFTPLTSRIKILADLDIAEKRVPQDGRIRYVQNGQAFDFRVSTLPTHFGEKTVIRILKHDKSLLDLKNLGISHSELEKIYELVEKPQGMIFVTGPTGSGKSSTLFACLNRIKHKAINITTIENPIEYKLEGVNQVQINEKAGVSFAAALRSILRQDPDVILVGEIRDSETAQIAVQASQTGHLVFSTLHTNDAISAITRLKDLGIPEFLISSSLLAIIAQRLVRVLCVNCKRETEMSDDLKKRWTSLLGTDSIPRTFSAPGCEACNFTGYKGRAGIFEIVSVNEKIRSMISDNISETSLRKKLRDDGFKTILQDGISKVEQGVTTPEELLRVVLVEDLNYNE
ncbi:MAG: Flp pilus assembly complex ATPase component TadA [Fibrobacter sp.]|jgi:type IV pilus assembly protein PilB|nr:Flp pilus assembly complex ATPase component TadA [Fibrobacter sp.]